jgi:hypothetical protein
MSQQIWKFPLPKDLNGVIAAPGPFRVLTLQIQDDWPCIWAIVDPAAPLVDRHIRVFGTGHELRDDQEVQYLGTFQLLDGDFVGHVFLVLEC